MRKESSLFSAALIIALLGHLAYSQHGTLIGHSGLLRVKGSSSRHDRYRGGSLRRAEEDELKPTVSDWVLRRVEPLEQSCFGEVNRQRRVRGLEPLKFSEKLLEVARYYSRRMAEEGFFSHVDLEGRTVRQRVDEAGIRWRVLGENLAYSKGYINPVAVAVRGWLESPGHRRNLLGPEYRYTAVGAWISNDGTVYFTEIFLR
jgi:uncharacterized protein YkwD